MPSFSPSRFSAASSAASTWHSSNRRSVNAASTVLQHSCARSIKTTGWFMPSLPLVSPLACCAILAAIPTESPSAISASQLRRSLRTLPMERLCARQQAAHHDAIRERVPAPLLPTCAAQRLRSHPPLRLSRQRTPRRSHRARSPAACLPASAKFTAHQLSVSHLALPTLRSQHEHRT
jgi:hypothetical protein